MAELALRLTELEQQVGACLGRALPVLTLRLELNKSGRGERGFRRESSGAPLETMGGLGSQPGCEVDFWWQHVVRAWDEVGCRFARKGRGLLPVSS